MVLAVLVIFGSLIGCNNSIPNSQGKQTTLDGKNRENANNKLALENGGFVMYDDTSKNIKIENEYISLEINDEGKLLAFTDKISGNSYLNKEEYFVMAAKGSFNKYFPVRAAFENGNLKTISTEAVNEGKIRFELANSEGDKVGAVVGIKVYNHYISFEINEITNQDSINDITFANLNTNINGTVSTKVNACYNNDFAVCVMALTLPVHCAPETVDSSTILNAKCYSEFGIKGNKFAIIATPFKTFLETVQEVEENENLPSPKLGGKWGKLSDDVRKSYLFIRNLTEENADDVIRFVKEMDAGMILFGSVVWRATAGHYNINKRSFPNGVEGMKAVVDKIHSVGLKAGLHFLPAEITVSDPYVTPVPDKRLYKDGVAVLTADISNETITIDCSEEKSANSAFPIKVIDAYRETGTDVLIDDEIIHYKIKNINRSAAGKVEITLEDCVRGAYGTKKASHKSGTKIYHLRRVYGNFQIDLETTLLDEVSTRMADIFNYCGFDMIYFDGSEKLQQLPSYTSPNTNHWYYNAKLQYTFYNKLDRKENILVQGSSNSHFGWHIISRHAIADGKKDIKRSLDSNMGKIEANNRDFIPIDIGWYSIGASHISYEDIEYILCRSIGFNSSVGFQESSSIGSRIANDMVELIKKYEKLRLENYFPEEVKEMLRKPGIDYKLIQDSQGRWIFVQ